MITDENLNTLNSEYYNGTLDDKYNSFAPVNSRFGIIETNVGFLAVIENFNYDTQRTSSYLIKLSADLSVNDEKFLYNNEKANINGFLKTSEEKIIGYGRAKKIFLTGSSKDHKSWLIFLESNLQFGDFFSYDKYNPSIYNKREAEIIDFKEEDTFYYGISLRRRLLVLNKKLF